MGKKLLIAGGISLLCGGVIIFAIPSVVALFLTGFASMFTLFDPLHAPKHLGAFWSWTVYFIVLMALCGIVVTPLFGLLSIVLRELIVTRAYYLAVVFVGMALYIGAHIVFAAAYYLFANGLFVPEVFQFSGLIIIVVAPLTMVVSMWAANKWGNSAKNGQISGC